MYSLTESFESPKCRAARRAGGLLTQADDTWDARICRGVHQERFSPPDLRFPTKVGRFRACIIIIRQPGSTLDILRLSDLQPFHLRRYRAFFFWSTCAMISTNRRSTSDLKLRLLRFPHRDLQHRMYDLPPFSR